MTATSNNTVG